MVNIRAARSILTALGLAATLAACSPDAVIDRLPGEMGLPAAAPSRPATPYRYPAVHDMPPPRAAPPLTEDQQFKLRDDLQSTRDRQEKRTGTLPKVTPGQKSNANATKKRDNPADSAGARANP